MKISDKLKQKIKDMNITPEEVMNDIEEKLQNVMGKDTQQNLNFERYPEDVQTLKIWRHLKEIRIQKNNAT